MSRNTLPPLNPEKSTAGIAVDPRTLDRVIPVSKRPDGTLRKEIKIRPGFTPQEDVRKFRGTRQTQMDANALPKGHIIGWAPPPGAASGSKPGAAKPSAATAELTGAAKKNAKRRAAKKEAEATKEDWDDGASDAEPPSAPPAPKTTTTRAVQPTKAPAQTTEKIEKPSRIPTTASDMLAKELNKLKM